MTTLTSKEITKFWIRLYLNTTTNLTDACIKRAYLDVCRTMHGIGKKQNEISYAILNNFIKEICKEVTSMKFISQNNFDEWHEEKCNGLIEQFKKTLNYKISYGQAQKWINMTFKYLFVLGERKINNIAMNYEFFHIPIDNIVLDKLSAMGISKLKTSWSRVDKYEDYLDYQNKVRSKFQGQIPMDVEFRIFIS